MRQKTFLDILIAFKYSEEEFLKNHPKILPLRKTRRRINWSLFVILLVSIGLSVFNLYHANHWFAVGSLLTAITSFLILLRRIEQPSSYIDDQKEPLKKSREYNEALLVPLRKELSEYVNLANPKAVAEKCMQVHKDNPVEIQEFVCFRDLLEKLNINVSIEQPTRQKPVVEHIFKCGDAETSYETTPEYKY